MAQFGGAPGPRRWPSAALRSAFAGLNDGALDAATGAVPSRASASAVATDTAPAAAPESAQIP